MQYCSKCKVSVRGNKSCCPLCEGKLVMRKEAEYTAAAKESDSTSAAAAAAPGTRSEGAGDRDPFPVVRKPRISGFTFFRICTFALIAVLILTWLLDYLIKGAHPSLGITQIIALLAWADLGIVGYFRQNAIKLVAFQLYLLIPLVLFLDYRTGGKGWAISYFIPCIFIAIAVLSCVIGRILKISFEVYVIYIFLAVILSLLQFIPILTQWNLRPAAAVISIAVMILIGAAVFLFRARDLKRAAHKWFNLD